MSRPIIGITCELSRSKKSRQTASYCPSGYCDKISEYGGIPILLPPVNDEERLQAQLDLLDGIVFTGSRYDLDPRNDGYMLHGLANLVEPRKELHDRNLMCETIERRLPVLAIGYGMQLMNIMCGGTLILHIPDEKPYALPHLDSIDGASHRHTLQIEKNSLMHKLFGSGEIRVNSMHHMALNEVARGFWVTARAPDGIIEAVQSEMVDWLAIGVQFHPEASSACALSPRIFEFFLEGISDANTE